LQPQVQKVGPEHFGIVSVDCAKARSKWMLADFYGNVLVPPTMLPHERGHFAVAIAQLREAIERHRLGHVVIAIEQTGVYHQPVKRAFAAAGFECRTVHPLASKAFRQAAHPGVKTDDEDLRGIFLAASNGFGLIEQPLDPVTQQLRLLARHRRDLVEKRSALCCQFLEHLDAVLPGFSRLFGDFWTTPAARTVARHFASSDAILGAGLAGLSQTMRDAGQQSRTQTLQRILAWARTAATADLQAVIHHRIALALDDDIMHKTREIEVLEGQLASLLVQTPYVLLLVFPGINVVSAAEFAGEMGPITHYAHANAITGRAGLFPSRYQSDAVDVQGCLVRCANRTLRAAILTIAGNLLKCNHYFGGMAGRWAAIGKDPRHTRVKIASRFSRIAYHIVAGRQILDHPALCKRGYILDKLIDFHQGHRTPPSLMMTDLQAAAEQLPSNQYIIESLPLVQRLAETRAARRRGPQPIGELLPLLLAKLGVSSVQSQTIGVRDLSESDRARSPQRLMFLLGFEPLEKTGALFGSSKPDTAAWGPSPYVPEWR
jgi:transposase